MSDTIEVESWPERTAVKRVILNRPDKYNAFSRPLMKKLRTTLESLQDDDRTRLLVLTGADPAFSSGADVNDVFEVESPQQGYENMLRFQRDLVQSITDCSLPVVAMVNGPAVGGGMSVALACDLVVASTEAYFQAIFPRIGLAGDLGLIYHLVHSIGIHRANELLLTGRRVEAEQAKSMGFVNQFAAPDRLEDETGALLDELLACAPLSLSHTKELVQAAAESTFHSFLRKEALQQGLLLNTEDLREGRDAFLEDRQPEFKGR